MPTVPIIGDNDNPKFSFLFVVNFFINFNLYSNILPIKAEKQRQRQYTTVGDFEGCIHYKLGN